MSHRNYVTALKKELELIDIQKLQEASACLYNSWLTNSVVWVAGNGGNSANALHFATDWSKGLFLSTGIPMKVQSLNANSALFSALANDVEKDEIFSFQLLMNAKKGDVAVLLSAGGGSSNILKAAQFCRANGIKSIGLIGGTNPSLKGSFDIELHTSSDDIQIVEDIHAIFGHLVLREIAELKENA
jgi:D-sedoheptulose 7-phosphate isomerase